MRNIGLQMTAAFTVPFSLFAKSALQTSGEFEQLQVAFETMIGNADKAKNFISTLTEFATKTPFAIKEVFNQAKFLLAVGFSADEVKEKLETLGNIAAGVGGPDAMGRLAYALGQVKSAGVLRGSELRQFTEAGVGIIDELSKITGIDAQTIATDVGRLSISYDQVYEALKRTTDEGGKFYNLMGKQNKTFLGQLNEMQETWELVKKEFGDAVKEEFELFIGALKEILKTVKKLSPTVKKVLFFIGAFLAILGPIIAASGQMILNFYALQAVAVLLGTTLKGMAISVAVLFAKFLLIAGFVVGLGLLFEDFYVWLNGGQSAFGDWYQAAWDSIKAVGRGFVWLWDKTKAIFSLIKDWIINQFKLAFFGVLRLMTMNLSKMAQLISKVTGTDFYDKTFKNFDKFIDAEIQGSAKFLTEDSVNRAKGILGIENNNNQRISNSITLNIENTDATPEVIAETTKDALQEFFDSQINDGLYNLQVD